MIPEAHIREKEQTETAKLAIDTPEAQHDDVALFHYTLSALLEGGVEHDCMSVASRRRTIRRRVLLFSDNSLDQGQQPAFASEKSTAASLPVSFFPKRLALACR